MMAFRIAESCIALASHVLNSGTWSRLFGLDEQAASGATRASVRKMFGFPKAGRSSSGADGKGLSPSSADGFVDRDERGAGDDDEHRREDAENEGEEELHGHLLGRLLGPQ